MSARTLTQAKRPGPAAPPKSAEPRPLLQRSAVAPAPASLPASVQGALDTPGRPLDGATRADMESRFSHDFSAVRIHDGPSAAGSATDVGANAYTVGQDIVFGGGGYAPETPEGRSLLAHELAHTVQQSGLQRSSVAGVAGESSPEYGRLEREAETAAHAVEMGGQAPPIGRASAPTLSRQTKKPKPAAPAGAAPPTAVTLDYEAGGTQYKHTVKPEGPIGAGKKKPPLPKFHVDTFYLPGDKGEGAEERYKEYATAGQLRSVVGFGPDGVARTELWQSRDRTEVLGESWLQQVGWPVDDKDKLWQAITGKSDPFPKAKGATAQIDHIVELQMGGTNNPSNLRPLDADPNQRSGRNIWLEVSGLAKAIRDEPSLGLGGADQLELIFDSVQTMGQVWRGTPFTPDPNALMVHIKAMSQRVAPTDDTTTKYIDLAVGANRDTFAVPATWGKGKKNETANLEEFSSFNKGPVQLVSSMKLVRLRYKSATTLDAEAELDLRNRTRIPLGTKAAAGGKAPLFHLTGTQKAGAYDLKLTSKPSIVEFDYPYLSRVRMTEITLNPSGDLDWKASVTPTVKFLPTLKVEYSQGQLRVITSVGDEIKKKKLLGFQITKAEASILLAPEFDIRADLAFVMGDPANPLVVGNLMVTKDAIGPVGQGKVSVRIPKVKEATSDITYKGGGGRDEWTFAIKIRSEDIALPGGISLSGALDAALEKGDLGFTGKLAATIPGGHSAQLELERRKTKEWVLTGRGTFKVPKVKQVSAEATYFLGKERLIVSTKDITFELFGLQAKLIKLTGEFDKDKPPVFEGAGEVELNKGKVSGKASVELKRNGKFTGKGSVSYKFNEKLTATAGVEVDEKERVKFSGQLVLTSIKLFDLFADKKNLFDLSISIPIPGASVGGVGLEARIGGGADALYSIGPGTIAPLIFTADFYPLEENSDLALGVEGQLNIPAMARLTAYIKGGIVLDAFIAEVGGELILEGWIELKGGLFAKFKGEFKQGKIAAKLTPEIVATLFLGLALKLRAWAKAGIGWLSVKTEKTWELGKREVDTRLGFRLSAPIEYATDTGAKFPTLDQVEMKKPEITSENLARIAKELVSGASTKEREV